MKFDFTIPLKAKAKQSTRFSRKGCFTDRKIKAYQNQVQWILAEQYQKSSFGFKQLINKPVKVDVKAYFKIPKKDQKQTALLIDKPYPKVPDGDNILKMQCDCLKGVVIEDDKIITQKSVTKLYGHENKVEISVEVLG